MVEPDLVAAKLADLALRVDRIRAHRRASAAELEADRDALDLVSFNLMVAVQICLDLASHLIADEGWPAARALAESFDRLADHDVVRPDTAEALRKAVGLRNVVAHGYGHVDAVAVHTASHAGLDDLDAFAREISAWVTTATSTRP